VTSGWFEEGVRRVRKLMFATLVACMLALMSMLSVPAVASKSAEPEPLICTIEITFNANLPNPHWEGTIAGDVEGTLQLWENWSEMFLPGATEHYFEDFVITIGEDQIKGIDKGVWNFGTYKFRYNGMVTDATGDWEYLEEYRVHGMGFTSEFPSPTGIITGTGTMVLVPP